VRVVITGAGGFVGQGLAGYLSSCPDALGKPIAKLVLADRIATETANSASAEWQCGDLSDSTYVDSLLAEPADCLFHLASVPGATAERQNALGWSVNLMTPLKLAERLASQGRATGHTPRVVFASSIAVYGPLGPGPVSDDHTPRPAISYGAHKLMTEILLGDLSRRGEIDARSLRLPGIVARPLSESGHGSAFMSHLFHRAVAGEAFVCPVSRAATAWWMSLSCCVANLVHAAKLSPDCLPVSRSFQLPAVHATIGDIVGALSRHLGAASVGKFCFEPDETIENLFGRFPRLAASNALSVGFESDGDADTIVANVLGRRHDYPVGP
jgi:nucleoside-diphosphate-sugar epimerase